MADKKQLKEILDKSIKYLEDKEYSSYDVYDGLNNPLITKYIKNLLLRRVIIQINAKSPINLRGTLGISPIIHTKTISDMLSVYSKLFLEYKEPEYLEKAEKMFNLLLQRATKTQIGKSWGLNFPYTSRFVNSGSETPNLYNTINSANAIIDYYTITSDLKLKTYIIEIFKFIFDFLGVINESEEVSWIRYYPKQESTPVANVNAMAAALFVRANSIFKEEIVNEDLIQKLINFIVKYQNPDGSWYYSTLKNGKWIDGFHTGFILESLVQINSLSSKYNIDKVLLKGASFYINNLITKEGVPKYFNNKLYPIESQNCAQALLTLSLLNQTIGMKDKSLLDKTFNSILSNLYDQRGYFYHTKNSIFTNKHYYARWSQTPMIISILHYLKNLNR
ncbi:MAG: hypothetical protein CFE21_22535 [Bacteroidetes bacterium B1(2017)]|nr:MAG: hypothetical protein CFE21_22535 [Bacteroidetes bacterium B1(2017)]